jgi:hypothetical protein
MNKIVLMLSLLLISGCQSTNPPKNPYTEFFSKIKTRNLPIEYAVEGSQPTVIKVDSLKSYLDKIYEMESKEYTPLGQSNFTSGYAMPKGALEQASILKASIVIIRDEYTNTEVSSYQTTSYDLFPGNPYTAPIYETKAKKIDKYSHSAVYMAKQPCHHCRTGMRYSNLSEQDKEIAQSNYGVVINLVIEGKIAYKSNLMRNDVVVSVNDEPIYDGSEFNAMLRRCIEEKKVAKLGVIRKGEPKTLIFKF